MARSSLARFIDKLFLIIYFVYFM